MNSSGEPKSHSKSKPNLSLLGKRISTLLATWFLLSFFLYLKIPEAFTKIYAEDGAISLQGALAKSFPNDFLTSFSGYLNVIGRVAGRIVSLFPLQGAAQAFFLFTTLMLTWIALTVYSATSEMVPNKYNRALLSLSLILLPIAGFESIATASNLSFFFMSACLPIFLREHLSRGEKYAYSFFVLVATLSTPLMIFYFPLVVYLKWRAKESRAHGRVRILVNAWLLGLVLQATFILTRAYGDRAATGGHSIVKTGFLYLDRVAGSTFLPHWGYVSDSTPSIAPTLFSSRIYLLLRAVLGLLVLFLFVLDLVRGTRTKVHLRMTAQIILLTGMFYWLVLGILFNPEPRYAIFPSFGLLLILFYIQGQTSDAVNFSFQQKVVVLLLVLIWLGSWSPSAQRVKGPTWAGEYKKAQATCLTGVRKVQIPIIPKNGGWRVVIECQKLHSS